MYLFVFLCSYIGMNKIDYFLSTCKSEKTKVVYRSHLKKFFKTIDADPDSYFEQKKSDKEYEKDVKKYWDSLKDKPPKTIRCALCTVKKFFTVNNRMLKPDVWKTISNKTQGSRAVTKLLVPTRKQVKELLSHGDTKSRAVFLVLLSSGMTIGELCQIKLNDLKLHEKPVRIELRKQYTRNQKRRHVFISNEAASALKEWLKIRKEYLDKTTKIVNKRFDHYTKSSNDDRIFPFGTSVVTDAWHKLLHYAKYDEKDTQTKRYRMQVQSLRKFFKNNLSVKVPLKGVEYFMGYETYLTNSNKKYKHNPKILSKMYQEGMSEVTIFEISSDSAIIEELQKKYEKQIKEKNAEITNLKAELQEMKTMLHKQR